MDIKLQKPKCLENASTIAGFQKAFSSEICK